MRALVFLLLSIMVLPAAADVLVYRGTARVRTSTNLSPIKAAKVFVAIDTETQNVKAIVSGKINGQKVYLFPPVPVLMTRASLPKKKFAVILTDAFLNDVPNEKEARMLYWRGTETSLQTRTQPAPATVTFPKVLTGFLNVAVESDDEGSFTEQNQTIRFIKKETIDVNNANLDLDGVFFAETTRLSQSGYKYSGL